MKFKFKCDLISITKRSKTAYLYLTSDEIKKYEIHTSVSIPFQNEEFELDKEYYIDIYEVPEVQ